LVPSWPDVKVCGVCDAADAADAVAAGATHIGVIRIPYSRRYRPLPAARSVCSAAVGALRVGVYADESTVTMLREADALGLDVIQLHGGEPPERVESLAKRGVEVWKTVRPERAEGLLEAARLYGGADLLLVEGRSELDSWGAGPRIRWGEVAAAVDRLPTATLIGISGGLTPDNVGFAVRRFRPAVVDVCAGVETSVGRKNPLLIAELVRRTRESAHPGGGVDDGG
jgi:phosphoribosylanthranilate isomerase